MADAATSPSTRFVPISTHHLSSEPASSETTLRALLDRSEQLAEEAREALPYSFDECTYNKGYLRQSVWSCIDCGEKGVCYGCSISCHAEHKLVELWTRRHFRCDCPTTSMPVGSTGKRRKCTLNPPEAQPQDPNDENRYGKNFAGKFCRCGKDYDPETETEAMLNCIGCEDWLHESCLNLVVPEPATTLTGTNAPGNDDDDDEEKEVLIPSETYDGLICASCVSGNAYLQENAGQPGWMIIEPSENGVHQVLGRERPLESDAHGSRVAAGKDEEAASGAAADVPTGENEVSHKRPAESDDGGTMATKRLRLDTSNTPDKPATHSPQRKGKGDVFLAHGVRTALKDRLPESVAESLPFPLIDEEIYEPPQDTEEDETLEQVTERVVGALPRVQAIEALHGYQNMKDKLKSMLASHAQEGRAVSKEDIDGFFEQLRASHARTI